MPQIELLHVMFSPNLYPQKTRIIGGVKGEETWLNLAGGGGGVQSILALSTLLTPASYTQPTIMDSLLCS